MTGPCFGFSGHFSLGGLCESDRPWRLLQLCALAGIDEWFDWASFLKLNCKWPLTRLHVDSPGGWSQSVLAKL